MDLEKAWQAVLPVKVQYLRSESNPQFAMIVSIPEIVMTVLLRVDVGESGHDLFVVYPYATIEPIKEKLYAGFFADHMEQDSDGATVSVTVCKSARSKCRCSSAHRPFE